MKNLKYLRHLIIREWWKIKIYFLSFLKNIRREKIKYLEYFARWRSFHSVRKITVMRRYHLA